jgi:hypothetical protein
VAITNGAGAAAADAVSEARELPNTADSPTDAKKGPVSLGNSASLEAKRPETKSGRRLEWQEVNRVTWRLIDPDASQIRLEASHGQWGGYTYPKALAYVFDVGVFNHDWRMRVRKRGRWIAIGSVIDADLAKRLALAAVENGNNYKNPAPDVPLNLLGGGRWPTKRIDRKTIAKVMHAEVGGELRGSADIVAPRDDGESINTCARDDEWRDWPASDDGAA